MVIPRGAPVQLTAVNIQKAGTVEGRDRIDLRVDSITFRGRVYPVKPLVWDTKTEKRGRRTLKGAGIGAAGGGVIGAIAGGGTGALVGALVGGGGGAAVSAATGRKHLSIPPETVLAFQLQAPLRVNRPPGHPEVRTASYPDSKRGRQLSVRIGHGRGPEADRRRHSKARRSPQRNRVNESTLPHT